ncbi:unnamed protein product, partial [Ranitomeya imitator]
AIEGFNSTDYTVVEQGEGFLHHLVPLNQSNQIVCIPGLTLGNPESRDTEEPEKLLKQGYLEKRNRDHGFFGSEWQKRWCVLSNISFCYYSNEKGRVPKGGFLIKDCGAQLVSNIRKDSRRDSCFELISPGNRSYEFTAASPGEAKNWVEQIQFLVKDIISSSIPCEDDEESYDDVDSLNSAHMIHPPPLNRAGSPIEDDDIYEVVPVPTWCKRKESDLQGDK